MKRTTDRAGLSEAGAEVFPLTEYAYNNAGQLTNVTWNVGGALRAATYVYEYNAFGGTVPANVFPADSHDKPMPSDAYTYSASAAGQYYYGSRHYSPETGRWCSRDPIEEKGGVNLYVFVLNHACPVITQTTATGSDCLVLEIGVVFS